MVDLTPFNEGIEAAKKTIYVYDGDPRDGFANELQSAGYRLDSPIIVGKLQRISDPNDKGKKRTGWYVYHEIDDSQNEGGCIGVGKYGSWRGDEQHTWTSRSVSRMSARERMSYNAQIEQLKAQRELEQQNIWNEAASRAQETYNKFNSANSEFPYLSKKKLINIPESLKYDSEKDCIVLPVYYDGVIVSLQSIYKDGFKRFLTGGRTKGGYYKINGNPSESIYIVEGYATGQSIHDVTGATVYVAFNCNNLYEITSRAKSENPNNKIIIAGDNDFETKDNPGKTKAMQAADGLSVNAIFPPDGKGTDFNDWICLDGADALRDFLTQEPVKAYKKEEKEKEESIAPPAGMMTNVYDFYNTTAGNKQLGFSLQTALAFGSIILGRTYVTDYNNYTSLFLLNIGKSGTGKEHAKTVLEKLLEDTGNGQFVSGDGYSSAGAVFSQLLIKPKHMSIIDEFGRNLESSSNVKGGDHHRREANTKLMEAIGRCHTVMRPQSYSTMTLKKSDAEALNDRIVNNPAITLLGMSTPSTLFKTLGMGAIKDGFVNRFIISISDAERTIRKHKPMIDTPQSIIDWAQKVQARAYDQEHISSEKPNTIEIKFTSEAMKAQEEFQWFCVDKSNKLEKFGMEELPGRSNEMAMRIALICALSRDPMADFIEKCDMEWAIKYVKACLEKTIDKLKVTISSSEYEGHKKEFLTALRDAGDWVRRSHMIKNAPYSAHPKKYIDEILDDLENAELVQSRMSNGAGRPTKEYVAI